MNKKLFVLPFVLAIGLSMALATSPSFEVHKFASVTGDWKWDGGWQNGEFETANYYLDAYGEGEGTYMQYDELGTPWKYEHSSYFSSTGCSNLYNSLSLWTVNDPATTPATGGYTKVKYQQNNYGRFSEAHVLIDGEGAVNYVSNVWTKTEGSQDVELNINEE